jgi:hypothetical protein
MISIKINGQELYIPEGTSLQLNIKNSIFDFTEYETDVIYTFDIPAKPNDIIFNHARFVYVKKIKIYEGEITLNGIPFATGTILIQNATQEKYSIGIRVNPYPAGWEDKLLANNSYEDAELGITPTDFATHWDKMHALLSGSLAEDSKIKFPCFYSEEFYPGWTGVPDPGECPNRTFARTYIPTSDAIISTFVNRFVIDSLNKACECFLAENVIVDGLHTITGTYYFNNYDSYYNTDALAPAIQLVYLLEKVINTAGYNAIGELFTDERVARVFYQSLRALDATPDSLYNDPTRNYWGYPWNIFTPSIPLADHCPNMTNGSLIINMIKLFGLTFYMDMQTKTIEMGFIKSIPLSKSVDLSNFVLSNEISIENEEKRGVTYKLGTFDTIEIPKDLWYREVNLWSDLPVDIKYVGQKALVKRYNAIYKCMETGSNAQAGTIVWVKEGGNGLSIDAGDHDDEATIEALEPNVIIPTIFLTDQLVVWEEQYPIPIVPKIEVPAISTLYYTGTTTFDMILTYYHGEFHVAYGEENFKCSACYPTVPYSAVDEHTTNDPINLKTTGAESLGEDFIEPAAELLQHYEEITYQFTFPVLKTLEVINLLRPQGKQPKEQTRWVLIDNVKMLPIDMTFEFTKGREMIKSEIKFAKMIHDV